MIFTEIAETATVTFCMDDLEAMARACRAAYECGTEGYAYEAAASAFTGAAMIARVHGDMPQDMRDRLARVHASLTSD